MEKEVLKVNVAKTRVAPTFRRTPEEALCDSVRDDLIGASMYLENAKQMLGVLKGKIEKQREERKKK